MVVKLHYCNPVSAQNLCLILTGSGKRLKVNSAIHSSMVDKMSTQLSGRAKCFVSLCCQRPSESDLALWRGIRLKTTVTTILCVININQGMLAILFKETFSGPLSLGFNFY